MATTTTATTANVHPFEAKGLGLAPFRFVGMGQQDRLYGEVIHNRAEYDRTGIAMTCKPGGTCDYCGEAIVNIYEIESSDGNKFHVGCDCVKKVAADAKDAKLAKAIARAKLQLDRSKRAAKSAARASEREAKRAELAATARDRLGATYDRLERASRINPVFGDMLERILGGYQEKLSDAQYRWLESHEARHG